MTSAALEKNEVSDKTDNSTAVIPTATSADSSQPSDNTSVNGSVSNELQIESTSEMCAISNETEIDVKLDNYESDSNKVEVPISNIPEQTPSVSVNLPSKPSAFNSEKGDSVDSSIFIKAQVKITSDERTSKTNENVAQNISSNEAPFINASSIQKENVVIPESTSPTSAEHGSDGSGMSC